MKLATRLVPFILVAALLVTPPAAAPATQTFPGVYYLVPTGKKSKQIKARLVLTDDSVQVYGDRGATSLKEIPYSEIKAATYSNSRHPRWKTTLVAAAALGLFAAPLLFMKGKKHWLTFQSEGDHAALRLSKKNFARIIVAVERQTGMNVERIRE